MAEQAQYMGTGKRKVEQANTKLMNTFIPPGEKRSMKRVREIVKNTDGLTEELKKNLKNKHAQHLLHLSKKVNISFYTFRDKKTGEIKMRIDIL